MARAESESSAHRNMEKNTHKPAPLFSFSTLSEENVALPPPVQTQNQDKP